MANDDSLPAESYWQLTRRPLQILLFLAPLIVLYEIGLAWLLRRGDDVLTNKAHGSLVAFFETLGVTGLTLGGIAIVVVLFVWHLLNRDPWRVDVPAAAIMAIESLLLALPLIAMGMIVQRSLPATAGPTEIELAGLDLGSRLAISIGAGLYEELLFRMLLIAVLHTLIVDVLKQSHFVGVTVAILVSAVAFTVYHPLRDAAGTLDPSRVVFFLLAGLYFGILYVARGFGIVVATHAFYDVIIVCLLPADG